MNQFLVFSMTVLLPKQFLQPCKHSTACWAAAAAPCHPLCHAGLFLPSQLSVQSEADMQRFAAPEQDCSSLDSLVSSASAASDTFMLGVLTYEVLLGKHAFPLKDDGIGRARRWQVLHALRCLLTWMQNAGTPTDLIHSCVDSAELISCLRQRQTGLKMFTPPTYLGYILTFCLLSFMACSQQHPWVWTSMSDTQRRSASTSSGSSTAVLRHTKHWGMTP